MKELTLEELQTRVTKQKERTKARQKANYRLARSLGFNTYEAMALQNHNEKTIRKLAHDRDTK